MEYEEHKVPKGESKKSCRKLALAPFGTLCSSYSMAWTTISNLSRSFVNLASLSSGDCCSYLQKALKISFLCVEQGRSFTKDFMAATSCSCFSLGVIGSEGTISPTMHS